MSDTNNNVRTFAVRNIIKTENGYSQVTVDNETFNKIRGMKPELPYSTCRDNNGRGVRLFEIDGATLMTRYDKETRKTAFIMMEDEANKFHRTLEQERANEPVLQLGTL